MNSSRPSSSSVFSHRLLAMGLAVLVFGLGLMSVNPRLHDWIHQECDTGQHDHTDESSHPIPASDDNHSCAIVTFAHGVALATPEIRPDEPPRGNTADHPYFSDRQHLVAPAYLLPPGRAPPQV